MKLWQYDEWDGDVAWDRTPYEKRRRARGIAMFDDLDEIWHFSTGSEYPDSPCGSSQNLTHGLEHVTCHKCLDAIIESGREAARLKKVLKSDGR